MYNYSIGIGGMKTIDVLMSQLIPYIHHPSTPKKNLYYYRLPGQQPNQTKPKQQRNIYI